MLRLAKLGAIWERIEARIGSIFFVQCVALVRRSAKRSGSRAFKGGSRVPAQDPCRAWSRDVFFNGKLKQSRRLHKALICIY